MSRLVTNSSDPGLGHGGNSTPVPQNEAYLVLSEADRRKTFLQPVRTTYVHRTCGVETRMSLEIAETYARDPWFYGSTYCVHCRMHRTLQEFTWDGDKAEMSPHLWDEATTLAVVKRKEEQGR